LAMASTGMNTPNRSSSHHTNPAPPEHFPFDRLFNARIPPNQLIPTTLANLNASDLRSENVRVDAGNSTWTAYREPSATLEESDTDSGSEGVDDIELDPDEDSVDFDSDEFRNEDGNDDNNRAVCNFGKANDKYDSNEKDTGFECLICSEKLMGLSNVASISGCVHLFCFNCIYEWSKTGRATSNQCPTCRATFKKMSTLDGSKVATVGSTDNRKMLRRLERNLWAGFQDFQNTSDAIGGVIDQISELQHNLGIDNDLLEIEDLIEELNSRIEQYFEGRIEE